MPDRSKRRSVTGREWQLFAQALFLLPATVVSLRLLGFPKTQAGMLRLFRERPNRTGDATAQSRARATARMVRAAARYGLFHPNCLPQSLVLLCLLRRQGIPSDLRIGVRKDAERLDAHAWVECEGTPVNDRDDVNVRFAPFPRGIVPPPARFP